MVTSSRLRNTTPARGHCARGEMNPPQAPRILGPTPRRGAGMFDYVIVGGGSAGCVLAGRLSEDPDVTVCLVEAGPADTTENIHVPALGGRLFRTHLDWDYDSHE